MTRSRSSSARAAIRRPGWRGLLLISLLLISLFACAAAAGKTIPLELGGETLHVELAITDAEQVRGLMYRKSMPEDAGMLFVYDTPTQVSYWMKNTYIPLSIAFLDSDKRVINMADMAPNNDVRTYPSRGPCRYVLEVNQGWFARHGVKEGDVVRFELPRRKGG
jgi:hypothetical protein